MAKGKRGGGKRGGGKGNVGSPTAMAMHTPSMGQMMTMMKGKGDMPMPRGGK